MSITRVEQFLKPRHMLAIKIAVDDLAVDRYRCRASVVVQKHQTQEMRLDQSIRCRKAIEGTGTFSIDPPGVEEVSRL